MYMDIRNCFILSSVVNEPLTHVRMTGRYTVIFVSASGYSILMSMNI